MPLEMKEQKTDHGTRIAVAGEVDVSNASELREKLEALLQAPDADIIVDLAQVPYIDSTGIGVLVGAAQGAREHSVQLIVQNPQRNVERVLSLLGIEDQLNIDHSDRA